MILCPFKRLEKAFLVLMILITISSIQAQKAPEGIVHSLILPHTSVKNQHRTNTCWSYCTLSMIESRILSDQPKVVELSEMYVVYHTYIEKFKKYLRFHGAINLSGGGQMGDVTDCIAQYGIVPRSVYPGKVGADSLPDHFNLDQKIKQLADSLVKLDTLPEGYLMTLSRILNKYLGEPPINFRYEGKEYTPKTFAGTLPAEPSQFIWMVSVEHHPKNCFIIPELPDNWALSRAFNLPLNEFVECIDTALLKGYTVAAALDISEPGLMWQAGIAQLVTDNCPNNSDDITGKCAVTPLSVGPVVTPEVRQRGIDNYTTTDDHGMEIVGLAKASDGQKLFVVKNSWGTSNCTLGYFYITENYLKAKMVSAYFYRYSLPVKVVNKLSQDF